MDKLLAHALPRIRNRHGIQAVRQATMDNNATIRQCSVLRVSAQLLHQALHARHRVHDGIDRIIDEFWIMLKALQSRWYSSRARLDIQTDNKRCVFRAHGSTAMIWKFAGIRYSIRTQVTSTRHT